MDLLVGRHLICIANKASSVTSLILMVSPQCSIPVTQVFLLDTCRSAFATRKYACRSTASKVQSKVDQSLCPLLFLLLGQTAN